MRDAALATCLLALFGVGCGTAPEAPETAEPAVEEEVELAILMGRMQRHAEKLGYSIAGKNAPLAGFYLEEIREMYEELSEIEMDDGMPIAHPAGVILKPALPPLQASLDAANWEEARGYYEMLINACNRCHTATVHQFIHVLPVEGEPPYSQRFGLE